MLEPEEYAAKYKTDFRKEQIAEIYKIYQNIFMMF